MPLGPEHLGFKSCGFLSRESKGVGLRAPPYPLAGDGARDSPGPRRFALHDFQCHPHGLYHSVSQSAEFGPRDNLPQIS